MLLFSWLLIFCAPQAHARIGVVKGVMPVVGQTMFMPTLPSVTPMLGSPSAAVLPTLLGSNLPTLQIPVSLTLPEPVMTKLPELMTMPAVNSANSASPVRVLEQTLKMERRLGNSPGMAANFLGGFFDGQKFPSGGETAVAVPTPPGRGWLSGSLGYLVYHRRGPVAAKTPPRVFVGGLALAQSFDVHFEKGPAPERLEYRLNLRGLAPSGWSSTKSVIDEDARDLAKMILKAASDSGSSTVELALHSYAAMVLQRMVQLDHEVEIADALALLKGARVTLFGPTTHVPGSESLMGNSMEVLAWGLRRFVDSIDQGDRIVEYWNDIAKVNPFFIFSAAMLEAGWAIQRRTALALAVRDIERMLKQDLSEPWPEDIEPLRQRFLAEVDAAAREPEWQEAALRRVRDGFALDFDDASAERLQSLGARIRVVYSHDDALLPWEVERLMLSKLGIKAPKKLPPVGTLLKGPQGIEAVIADGDHYLPLMRYDRLPEHLER